MFNISEINICVVGLGYVGLPLAAAFGKKYPTTGVDVNESRISQLRDGIDSTKELTTEELKGSHNLSFVSNIHDVESANFYIVTVPTPIDDSNQPDLSPLVSASQMLAGVIKAGDIVVYESTVYPGATEEVCLPILEQGSGLTFNEDFFLGYSPERINPGDKEHRIESILKVTSGSTNSAAEYIDSVYASVITAGTHRASSIKVAEAAKVIENTQRDLNIALINELSLIFNRLNIDTLDVLEAAGTKWNFMPFRPGLVGGHCIGVDPYYLTHKAENVGYHPQVILAGRRINDNMSKHVVSEFIKESLNKRIQVAGSNVLVLGLTFKENCPDIRNTKVVDMINELRSYSVNCDVYDPLVDKDEVERTYGFRPIADIHQHRYDGIILAVAHNEFLSLDAKALASITTDNAVIFDLKNTLPRDVVDFRL